MDNDTKGLLLLTVIVGIGSGMAATQWLATIPSIGIGVVSTVIFAIRMVKI